MWFRSTANPDTPLHPSLRTDGVRTVGDLILRFKEVVEAVGERGEKHEEIINRLNKAAENAERSTAELRSDADRIKKQIEALSHGYHHLFRATTSAVDQLIEIAEGLNDAQRSQLENIAEGLVRAMQEGRAISLGIENGEQ